MYDITTGSLPGLMTAHQLIEAIRSKCTPEETLIALKELANPLADDTGKFPWHIIQKLHYMELWIGINFCIVLNIINSHLVLFL